MSEPLVSVCIVTYQHARFIARAVEGALMQKTDFPFEILIGEDESTDGTRAICQDYAKTYPDRIRVFLRSRSNVLLIDGRPRGGYNFRMTLREAKGEFIALCEGDDYWTDPEKLQRQVEYLRAHPDCVGCFHDTTLVDGDGSVIKPSYFQSNQEKFSQTDVLDTLMSSFATCSLVFRREAWEPLPGWFLRRPCDLYLDVHITRKGSLGFINRNMGAYRKHSGGIWSGQRESNQIIELIIRYKLLLTDEPFIGAYRPLILKKIDEFQALLYSRQDSAAELSRLDNLVKEQANAFAATQAECTRLTKEAERGNLEWKVLLEESNGYVSALKAQLDGLAETNFTQASYIKTLEAGRDQEESRSRTQLNSAKVQRDELFATAKSQFDYISVLEKERNRLESLATKRDQECEHYVQVINEQAAYIEILKSQIANCS